MTSYMKGFLRHAAAVVGVLCVIYGLYLMLGVGVGWIATGLGVLMWSIPEEDPEVMGAIEFLRRQRR